VTGLPLAFVEISRKLADTGELERDADQTWLSGH